MALYFHKCSFQCTSPGWPGGVFIVNASDDFPALAPPTFLKPSTGSHFAYENMQAPPIAFKALPPDPTLSTSWISFSLSFLVFHCIPAMLTFSVSLNPQSSLSPLSLCKCGSHCQECTSLYQLTIAG